MEVNRLIMAMNAINPSRKQANKIIKRMGYPENKIMQRNLKDGKTALLQSNDTGIDEFCVIGKDGSFIDVITENIVNIKRGMSERLWKKKKIYSCAGSPDKESSFEKERCFLNGKLKGNTKVHVDAAE